MLSSPLGRHILDYGPLRDFFIPTFEGFTDPYDHMLHYNRAMTLNAGNDLLLCKIFPASLRGLTLIWFHKLPRNSINMFYKLWGVFILQHLCSVRQQRNISSLQTILKHEEESHMRLHKEVRASRLTNRILQHGCNSSELQKSLRAFESFLQLAIFKPVSNNGRVIQAGRQILNAGGQYPSSNPDSHDHKLAD